MCCYIMPSTPRRILLRRLYTCRDGIGGPSVRLHIADFLGQGALDALEQRAEGLGPYSVHHQWGLVTSPAHEGGPKSPRECMIVVSKHGLA